MQKRPGKALTQPGHLRDTGPFGQGPRRTLAWRTSAGRLYRFRMPRPSAIIPRATATYLSCTQRVVRE